MIQGTTSDAGKTTVVAGLCRLLQRRGFKVAPFKPQNMALNSAVTPQGGEIGRAQALQARAAKVDPHTDMNPILLKPNSDVGAQIIVHGQAIGNLDAVDFHRYKPQAMQAVLTSWQRLNATYASIVVEGAGSPAEINLRQGDIANMGFAEAVDCPVLLVADIDRGGVFAHLAGTLELLSASERERIEGFIINRFRGDMALLQPGLDWLEQRTGKPVLGVLPYLPNLRLDAEDAVPRDTPTSSDELRIVVPVLPRISNHTDFEPLRQHPQVNCQFVTIEDGLPACDLVILPGSKSVLADLASLRQHGWDNALKRHLRYGGKLMGICGGFQMLGTHIHDPEGIEGEAGSSLGLKLLDMQTELAAHKTLRNRQASLCLEKGGEVVGYEIHCGISHGTALSHPLLRAADWQDGALSADQHIAGTYLHGLFDRASAMSSLLNWAGLSADKNQDWAQIQETQLDRLADCLHAHSRLGEIWPIKEAPDQQG